MRNIILNLSLLLVISGLTYAQEPSAANSDQNQTALSQQLLPYREGFESIKLEDRTEIRLYSDSLSHSPSEHLFYLPIPKAIFDRDNYYNPENGFLNFNVAVPHVNDSIKEKLTNKDLKNKSMQKLPIRGYEISIVFGNKAEVVKVDREAVDQIHILGSIPCPHYVTDPDIKQALKDFPQSVSIEIKFDCKFKEAFGSEVRIEVQDKFERQLMERILNSMDGVSRDGVLCSKQTVQDYLRNVQQNVAAEYKRSASIVITGQIKDGELNKWVENVFKQNPSFFTEKRLGDFEKINKSVVVYTPDFARYELQPGYVDNLVKSKDVKQEVKKHFLDEWNHYKEWSDKSDNVQDFKKRVDTDASHKGGFSLDLVKVIKIGADGDTKFKRSSASDEYTRNCEDLYSLLKDKSFNVSDTFDKYYENLQGDMKEFYTNPKDYRVVVMNRSNINKMVQFYFQSATLISVKTVEKFVTSIGESLNNVNTNKRIKELNDEVNNLKETIIQKDNTIGEQKKIIEILQGGSK